MPFCRSLSVAAAGAAACAPIPSALADTAALTPVADATLFEPPFKDLQRASGAGPDVYVGKNNREKIRRALLRFDLSSIPPGSTITSVSLRVHVTRTSSGPADVGLYLCTSAWGEGASDSGEPGGGGVEPEPGDATWAYTFWPDALWTAAGGDFLPDARAVASVTDAETDTTWESTAPLVADVQAWLDGTTANHGWLLHHVDEDAIGTSKRLASRENETPEFRPTLTVDYTPPGPVCIADFNNDGIVNSTDVSDFINQWFQDLVDGTFLTDWDHNGVVNSTDVSNFINDWFASPPECLQ
jgi:hypothetical protein